MIAKLSGFASLLLFGRSRTQLQRPSPPVRLGWRPALDGVRGVAILLVLLNHGGRLNWGFVGVDIFFALSGFLITTLLCEEWDDTGRISFPAFYRRRARRLLPALVLLVVGVAIAEQFEIMPHLLPLGIQILTTLLFLNNWVGPSYPDGLGVLGPTWSLGVEEQFYLVWPLTLFLLLRRGTQPRNMLILLVVSVLVLTLFGPGLGTVIGVMGAHGGFGNPLVRAAEPLVGCIAALIRQHFARTSRPLPMPVCWRWMGWLAVPAIAWIANSNASWPIRLIGPALCTGVLILSVLANEQGILTRILAFGPLRYTGRISYGLYLYQEPGNGLIGHFLPDKHLHANYILWFLAFNFALAMPSWHFIEAKFLTRQSRVVEKSSR